MPQIINTNIASLNAQRNLNTSQSALATSLQRLSSGLRINSAKDDAAGLSIAQRFTAQINGLNQAARNANDGISLAQTAEGDLTQAANNLQRIRELAVQSANGTNSSTDRVALNNESQQLIAEIDRVAQNSKFNGVSLLDGTFTNQQFQVGANAGETINITSIASARTAALGQSYAASVVSPGPVTGAASTGANITINGVSVNASVSDGVSSVSATGSAKALATAINSTSGTNVSATASTSVTGTAQVVAAGLIGTFTINGVSTATVTTTGVQDTDQDAAAAAINAISAATGVIATATHAAGTGVTLAAQDGRNVASAVTGTLTAAATGVTAATTFGTLSFSSTGTSGINVSAGNAILGGVAAVTAAAQTGVAVAVLDLTTVAGANAAISSIDSALASVNSSRASLGAYQNRFSSVVASLQTTSENLSASRSRIQDTDYAVETAALTRGQILQQAGTAILAQANQLPNTVLALLK